MKQKDVSEIVEGSLETTIQHGTPPHMNGLVELQRILARMPKATQNPVPKRKTQRRSKRKPKDD